MSRRNVDITISFLVVMGHLFSRFLPLPAPGLLAVNRKGDCCQRVRLPCSSVRVSTTPIASESSNIRRKMLSGVIHLLGFGGERMGVERQAQIAERSVLPVIGSTICWLKIAACFLPSSASRSRTSTLSPERAIRSPCSSYTPASRIRLSSVN